jgi:pimeloyl-ACP methyl ester carboxylesterase
MKIEKKYVKISRGNIAYLEVGIAENPTILFVHGIPTSSFLWRHVLDFLQNDFHCIAPDLMGLGDTKVDIKSAKFHMEAQAQMLSEFMTVLGYEHFGVVCHDQGAAAVQLIAAHEPDKLTCVVFTDCVCYDNWPSPTISKLQKLAKIPLVMYILTKTGFFQWRETKTKYSSFRRTAFNPKNISNEAIIEYVGPDRRSGEAFKYFKKFLLAGDAKYTMQAVPGLKKFQKPTLIIWAAEDPELSLSWGKKLYDEIPGACRFEIIPFCGHFWQEEKPCEVASIIGDFFKEQCGMGNAQHFTTHDS